jgi:Ser/Thr protein kinase RdoA (MazF antagonist)
VDVVWGDDTRRRETYVVLARAGGGCAEVFRYPHDPALPGLADATVPSRASALLGEQVVSLDVVAYRPGRRAVVHATTASKDVYLKVLRPRGASALRHRLAVLGAAVPVPAVLVDAANRGVVGFEARHGRTLRAALAGGNVDAGEVPDADAIVSLLDRFGAAGAAAQREGRLPAGAARRSLIRDVRGHGELLACAVPSSRRRVERLVAQLGDDTPQAPVFVHGDFHGAQLLVDRGRITSILDVDDAGTGARVDDLATFVAHLVIAERAPASHHTYLARALDAFGTLVDPAELRRRVAAVLIGLAAGPFRNQRPRWRAVTLRRLTLAEVWLASADSRRYGARRDGNGAEPRRPQAARA